MTIILALMSSCLVSGCGVSYHVTSWCSSPLGHVIYEMSAGLECPHLVPSEEDYEHVKEESCREVLRYIFENGDFKRILYKM